MIQKHHAIERVYVSVSSIFDSTGYMQPTSITWTDGRTFPIESVRDYRHHPGPGETSVFRAYRSPVSQPCREMVRRTKPCCATIILR